MLAPRLLGSIAGVLLVAGCAASPPPATHGQTPAAASSTGGRAPDSSPATTSSGSPSLAPSLLASDSLGCDITGKLEEFPIQLNGLFEVSSTGDHILVAQEGPGALFAYEDLTIGSDVWSRSNGEPWGELTGRSADVARLRRSIDQASGWTDLGAQAPASPSGRRLKAAGAPVNAGDFGLEYPEGFDSSLTLEIETADDGSPVAMHIAGKALSADLACGGTRTVSRPASPPDWKRVELSHGVSVTVPDDWELDRSDPTKLVVAGPDDQWMAVQGASAKGLTLKEWTSDGAAYFSKNWQATPEAGTLISVADQDAVLAKWHLPLDGTRTHFLNASVVRDGLGYDIEFFSQTGREPADRALFEQILTSVAFGKP